MARRTRRRHAAPSGFPFTIIATGSLALALTVGGHSAADQAVSKESDEVASHYLKHAGYLKEDVVGGIVLVRVQGIIKLLRATHEEEDILIGVRVATMQKP